MEPLAQLIRTNKKIVGIPKGDQEQKISFLQMT